MKKLSLFAAILVAAGSLHADVLARYTFDGSVRTSLDNDPNSNAGSFLDGPGFASAFDTGRGNPAPSLSISLDQINGTSNATAVTANDYFTFTITPVDFMSFTSLTFDIANYTNDGTFSPVSFFVRSSVNNFSSNIGTTQTVLAGSNGTFQNANISLTGASFQNLNTPVEFRIYVQDSGIDDPDRGGLIDNVILNGTAIPEPSTYAMMGLGAALLVGFQRFRRRQ